MTGLRTGWTTGTCASAAAKAAATWLVDGAPPSDIEVGLPDGRRVRFPVADSDPAAPHRCAVVKDAGDDPDCTHGAHVTALVERAPSGADRTELRGGDGVGTITKPGLGLPVGAPAINPVPERMIRAALREVTPDPLVVTISVPGGQAMAAKTSNARLGIVGGISILGTTGVVKPFSTASYRASVVQQIEVAAAQQAATMVLATGSRSDVAAQRLYPQLDPVCFVEVGDFTGIALRRAAGLGFERAVFVGMAGKITKLAAGVMMTHFRRSKVDGELLAEVARESGAPADIVAAATETATARHFFEVCMAAGAVEPLRRLCRARRRGLPPTRRRWTRRRGADGRLRRAFGGGPWLARPAVAAPHRWPVAVVGLLGGVPYGADAQAALVDAEVLVGTGRHLEAVGNPDAERRPFDGTLAALLDTITDRMAAGRRVCVLASGDPGFFGIVRALAERFGPAALAVHPAPSSVALAFARLGVPWDDAAVVSAHGRDLAEAVALVRSQPKVAVLVSPDNPPEALAKALLEAGTEDRDVAVCTNLAAADEVVVRTDLAGLAAGTWDPLSVVVLWRGGLVAERAGLSWGLPEERFAHRAGMITKAEVRAIALGKLDLPQRGVLWDVGAGSGSVAVECARLAPLLQVVAIERDERDGERIRANAAAHRVAVQVVVGEAPAALDGLPDPDRAFVGGGGLDVLDATLARLRAGGTVVATYAALDRAAQAWGRLGSLVQVAISRGEPIGRNQAVRLAAENPVFVCWGPS